MMPQVQASTDVLFADMPFTGVCPKAPLDVLRTPSVLPWMSAAQSMVGCPDRSKAWTYASRAPSRTLMTTPPFGMRRY